jgi:C-terminal processing protease CtpA/Prc
MIGNFTMNTFANHSANRYLLATLLALTSCLAQAEPGSLGISIAISTDGIFSTTLEQAKITAVKPNSPSEAAGLRANDLITRIEDCKIPGCPGGTAKKLMDKEAGQTLRLTIQREGQPEREVAIILGKKGS